MALVELDGLHKSYPVSRGALRRPARLDAVSGVTLRIPDGHVLGLVGESGSGKSTIGRLAVCIERPTRGTVRYDGEDLGRLSGRALRQRRRLMQMIFQDPFASLNPHMRVGTMLEEPLIIHRLGASAAQRRARIEGLLDAVGMPASHADRFPHEFSGGQRQRLCIARALAVEPRFIVADEAVSALDVSVQAQVVNILRDLRQRLGLTLLFISHNLAVVRNVADTIAVLYLGRLMEIAPARALFAHPRHPYTAALLSAIPVPDPTVRRRRIVLSGEIPSPMRPPSGCVFRTRCPHAVAECAREVPPLRAVGAEHHVACLRDDVTGAAHAASPAAPGEGAGARPGRPDVDREGGR